MVLSALTGDSDAWEEFQDDWVRRVMPYTKGAPMGVADCLSGRGDFRDIPEPMRMAGLREAVLTLNNWAEKRLTAYSCAILMNDYQRFVADSPKPKPNSPEAICVDDIIPRIDYQFPDGDTRFELYFDRSERFLRQVEPYWRRTSDRRKHGPYFLRRVAMLAPGTDDYAGIQGADVYTWTVHTYCRKMWLGRGSVLIPDELMGIVREPSISRLWDYGSLMWDNSSRNRVLASMTRVPQWKVTR